MNKSGENRKFSYYNFFPKNNRGISDVIVTVILVGLVLVAIAIVWVVIRNLLSQATGGIGLGGLTIRIEIQNAYKSGSNIFVELHRLTGQGTILGAVFVVSNETDTETINQDFTLNELETKKINFTLSKINIATATKVSVAPVFASSSNQRTIGEIQSTFTLGLGITGGSGDGEEPPGGGEEPPPETEDCTPACSGTTPVCLNTVCVQCISVSDCPSGTTWESCTNNVCVPPDCVPESAQQTCGSWTCGSRTNNCGEEITCPPGCVIGQKCSFGTCVLIEDINHGTVEDVWPPGSNIYFASTYMNTGADYTGKYVSFPESLEINCRLIAKFVSYIDAPAYGKSIAEFNFETAIAVGNTYKIWEGQEDCQYSIGQL